MKKRTLLPLVLFGSMLFSCVDPNIVTEESSSVEESSSSGPRVFEAFGPYSAMEVEDICRTYAERKKDLGYEPESCFLEYDLGVYGAAHVNIIKYVKRGKSEVKVEHDFSFFGYYICTLPSHSYDVNVWIKGQGSFDLKKLYQDDLISDADIKAIIKEADRLKIRRGGTFNTELSDFSFNLNWGYTFANTYDSGTEVIDRGGKLNTYSTSFHYSGIETIYERVKNLDIYSYEDEFVPGYSSVTNPELIRNMKYRYKMTIGDKTIAAYFSSRNYLDKSNVKKSEFWPQYEKFLELVIDIKDVIEASEEWNSMAIPEDDLLVDYG